jgi:hypothetical protein
MRGGQPTPRPHCAFFKNVNPRSLHVSIHTCGLVAAPPIHVLQAALKRLDLQGVAHTPHRFQQLLSHQAAPALASPICANLPSQRHCPTPLPALAATSLVATSPSGPALTGGTLSERRRRSSSCSTLLLLSAASSSSSAAAGAAAPLSLSCRARVASPRPRSRAAGGSARERRQRAPGRQAPHHADGVQGSAEHHRSPHQPSLAGGVGPLARHGGRHPPGPVLGCRQPSARGYPTAHRCSIRAGLPCPDQAWNSNSSPALRAAV